MTVQAHIHHGTCIRIKGHQISPLAMWVPKTKLKSLCSVPGAFTC